MCRRTNKLINLSNYKLFWRFRLFNLRQPVVVIMGLGMEVEDRVEDRIMERIGKEMVTVIKVTQVTMGLMVEVMAAMVALRRAKRIQKMQQMTPLLWRNAKTCHRLSHMLTKSIKCDKLCSKLTLTNSKTSINS